MLLSIIIVSYNTKELLEQCLDSIVSSLANGSPTTKKIKSPRVVSNNQEVSDQVLSLANLEVIVVDNNSTDGTREYLEALTAKKERPTTKETASLLSQNQFLKVKTIFNSENAGFARAVNQGLKKSTGVYFLLLNPDIRVLPGAITKLIEVANEKKNVGIVAPKLLNKDGKTSQASCYNLPTIARTFQEFWLNKSGVFSKYLPRGGQPSLVEAVVGAAMLIPKKVIALVGHFEEKFFMYYEDLNFCQRVGRAGLKVYYVPQAKMVHHHGASGKKEPQKMNRYLIESSKKFHGIIKHSLINFLIKASPYRSLLPLILIIGGLLLYAVFPLLRYQFFDSHDGFFHLIRLAEFDKAIRAGQFPPRWAPGLAGGLGAPVFNYLYPLVYYLGGFFHLLGFSLAASIRLLFVLGLGLGFWFTFLFLKNYFSVFASLVGAFFYVFAPYTFSNIYVRGTLAEFWALMLLPGLFGLTKKIFLSKKITPLNLFLFALLGASLITAHNIVALWGLIFFLIFIVFCFGKKFFIFSFPVLTALGLSAFFWLPALLEMPLAHLSKERAFNWWDHFPTIRQLVYSPWDYGVSLPGPGDSMSFQVGPPHLLLFLSALLLITIYFFKKQIKLSSPIIKPLILFILASFFLIFLMNHRSSFLWQNLPFLPRTQFPWRFLGFLNFTLVFPITFLFNEIISFKKLFWVNFIILIFLTITIAFYYPYPRIKREISEEKVLGSPEASQTTTTANEVLPIWAPLDYYRYDFNLALPCQDFYCQTVINLDQEKEVVFAKFYFPSWQSNLGNLHPQEKTGLIAINLPGGEHNLRVYWQESKIQKIANTVSLFSLVVIAGYGLLIRKRS